MLDNLSLPGHLSRFFLHFHLHFNTIFFWMEGIVFDIKRFAIHDGPGIRTTVFLKGCPLRCWWCHNPESQELQPETDIKMIPLDGKTFEQKRTVGNLMSVEEVMAEIDKEAPFYEESGGGVTFSGGEPLMQHDFLLELLKACKIRGYHTAVDTTGYVRKELLEKVIPYTDVFLFDIKHLDSEKHKDYTGVGNTLILENLRRIAQSRSKIVIRVPVIPGISNSEAWFSELKHYLETFGYKLKEVHLLPYHSMAKNKYQKFNKINKLSDLKDLSKSELKPVQKFFEEAGFIVKIGG